MHNTISFGHSMHKNMLSKRKHPHVIKRMLFKSNMYLNRHYNLIQIHDYTTLICSYDACIWCAIQCIL